MYIYSYGSLSMSWYYIKVLPFIQIEYCVTSALSQRKSQMASWVLITLEEAKC